MTPATILELVIAAIVIAGGIFLYRRKAAADVTYGSQSAVLLLAVGAILLIHGLGGLAYHRHGILG